MGNHARHVALGAYPREGDSRRQRRWAVGRSAQNFVPSVIGSVAMRKQSLGTAETGRIDENRKWVCTCELLPGHVYVFPLTAVLPPCLPCFPPASHSSWSCNGVRISDIMSHLETCRSGIVTLAKSLGSPTFGLWATYICHSDQCHTCDRPWVPDVGHCLLSLNVPSFKSVFQRCMYFLLILG